MIDKNGFTKQVDEHYMNGSDNGNGYLTVMLTKNGKGVRRYIHRLVAQAFISNPDDLPEVNHKDENRYNNIVTNLEWVDYLTNRVYGTRLERLSTSNTIHTPIIQYDLDFNFIAEYKNAIEAATILGFGKRSNLIYKCANKKANTAYGYIWRYKDDSDIHAFPIPCITFKDIYQYNATTGEFIKHYYHTGVASKEMGITPIILRKYLDSTMAVHNYFWCSKLLSENEILEKIKNIQNLPVKGVKKDNNKWYSSIGFNKQKIKLGSFDNETDAIKARLQKEIELYGVFESPQSYLFNKYLNFNP